jgi:hypothetical protein
MKKTFAVSSLSKMGIDTLGLDPDSQVERKQFVGQLTISNDEERTIIAKISTTDVDADGDIVIPSGCDTSRYVKNPICVWGHDYSKPAIGKILELKINPNDIEAKIQFATTEHANEIWELTKGGFLRCHSIGFIVQECLFAGTKEFADYAKKNNVNVNGCSRIISKWMLLEDSVVNLPSNASAVNVQVSVKELIKEVVEPKVEEVKATEPVTEPVCLACDKPAVKGKFCSKACLDKMYDEQMPMYEPEDEPEEEPMPEEAKAIEPEVIKEVVEVVVEVVKPTFKVLRVGKANITEDNKARIIAEYKDISKSKII